MMTLAYKPDLAEVVERHRRLWRGQMPDGILAAIFPTGLPFIDPLTRCPDIPGIAEAWDHNYRVRAEIQDDLLPVARVSFGSAAFGAYLGAEVVFDGAGGWSRPLLGSYDQLDSLGYDPHKDWVRRQEQACRFFLDFARGKFAVCETEPIDALNFAELLRGSAVYTDLYDYPEQLHRLIQVGLDFNLRFLEMQRQILAPVLYYEEGLFSMFRIWLPGKAVWISVDAYGNCSPKVFREFGASYLQQTIDHFGGGWIHVHASGIHLLPELAKLDGVLGIGIADDPNVRPGFSQLSKIRQATGKIPLQVDCTAAELETGLSEGSLPGGVMYMVKDGVESVEGANRLMERVRAYHFSGEE